MKALDWGETSDNPVTFDISPKFRASEVLNFESQLLYMYNLHTVTLIPLKLTA